MAVEPVTLVPSYAVDDVEAIPVRRNSDKPMPETQHYMSYDLHNVLEQSEWTSIFSMLKDGEKRLLFRNFMETQISLTSLLMLTVAITLMAGAELLVRWLVYMVNEWAEDTLLSKAMATGRLVFGVLVIFAVWSTWYLKRAFKMQLRGWFFEKYGKAAIAIVQPSVLLMWVLLTGLSLIHRAMNGSCSTTLFYRSFACNINHESGGLPDGTASIATLLPLAIFTVLPDTRFSLLLISICLSTLALIASGMFVDYRQMIGIVILYVIVCVIIVYETPQQKVSLFLLADRLNSLLLENQRRELETHAVELRHMIGNVAHDLKSPLASFTTALETISQIVRECRLAFERSGSLINTQQMLQSFQEIMSCINSISDTNSFMVMTINRCIDFTKASKGMTLSARLETVHLEDAIGLPVRIMRDLKSSVSISVSELGSEVCSHVITDKQWLQENLLCLLSNAVKYSGRGSSVDVCVRLMSGDAVRKFVEDDHSKCGGEEVFSATLHQIGPTQSSGSVETHGRARVYSNETVNIDEPNKVESNGSQFHGHDFSASDVSCSSPHMQGDDKINSPKHKRAKFVTVRGGQNKRETGQDKFLFLEVQDTGIGLTDEARRNLFKPFKQAQRLAGGTGLGLFSLAKRLDALGGYYGVKGRRDGGEGSLFWFAFPYRPDMESASLAAASPKRVDMKYTATLRMTGETYDPSGTSNALAEVDKMSLKVASKDDDECDRKGLRILLVDDSLSILKMTRMMLMRHKHEVMTAENGLEALEVMKAAYEKMLRSRMGKVDSTGGRRRSRGGKRGSMAPFDVLLMDLQMPVLDGLESARRIRSLEEEFTKRHEIDLQSNYDSVSNLGENGVGRVLCSPQSNDFTYCHQFIVGVSANSDEQTVDQSHMAGFDAFIGKPFQVETLYAVLEEHLKDEEG